MPIAWLVPVASAQQPPAGGGLRSPDELGREFRIQLEPPGRERVFRVESEEALRERIRQEYRQRGDRAEFPKETPITAAFPGRSFPLQVAERVPNVVCYHPLYFEDKNVERYGWDAGIFQPLLSTGKFYADLVALPYKMGVQPPHSCECNTGYYLPGDCVPYLLYVPPPSLAGAALQTGAVVGGIAVFP